jgi:hypothetical protein
MFRLAGRSGQAWLSFSTLLLACGGRSDVDGGDSPSVHGSGGNVDRSTSLSSGGSHRQSSHGAVETGNGGQSGGISNTTYGGQTYLTASGGVGGMGTTGSTSVTGGQSSGTSNTTYGGQTYLSASGGVGGMGTTGSTSVTAGGASSTGGLGATGGVGGSVTPSDWYVDPAVGSDQNPGTKELPFKSLGRASKSAVGRQTV